jgi:hypothetical protein
MVFFECYRIVAVKDAVHHRGNRKLTLSFTPPPFFFKLKSSSRFLVERIAKDLDAILGSNRVFTVQYCFGSSWAVLLVSGSDPKVRLLFTNYVEHSEWNLLRKHCPLFGINQFSSSRVGFECEYLMQRCPFNIKINVH